MIRIANRRRWATIGLVTVALAAALGPVRSAQAATPVAQAASAPSTAARSALTTATLHIIRIKCYGQNDTWGSDEPYFAVNGDRVWERDNVDYLDTVQVDVYVPFTDVVTVEMWEDDGGLTGRDDLMARWFTFSGETSIGVQSRWTTMGGGSYIVYYEVVP